MQYGSILAPLMLNFPNKPYYFFENQIPLAMQQADGLAVNGDDLYILFRDPERRMVT